MRTLAGSLLLPVLTALTSTSPDEDADALMSPLMPLISTIWPVFRCPRHWKSFWAAAGRAIPAASTPAARTIIVFTRMTPPLPDDPGDRTPRNEQLDELSRQNVEALANHLRAAGRI